MMIDKNVFFIYIYLSIYLYVYTHSAQLFTVNYLLSTTIVYDDRCIHIDIKANKREKERNIDVDITSIISVMCSRWIHLFHDKNNKKEIFFFFFLSFFLRSEYRLVHICHQTLMSPIVQHSLEICRQKEKQREREEK